MIDKQEKILIVGDEKAIRRLLHQKLSREGYQCYEAENGDQALDWLRGNSAEVLLLDIKMPSKSGIDLLSEIKTRYLETSVIVATVVNDVSTAIKCMKQGADDYIFKPFKLDEVALSVEKTLEQRNLQLRIREYQQHLEEVDQKTAETRHLFLGAIEAMVFALEAKDVYTAGHSQRVTEIALSIAKELNMPPDDMEDLRCSGLLHDVGKIAVDQLIQNKPGRLTPEEYEHIMIHAHVGAGIVRPVVNENVVEIIDHHHDRYDGTGFNQTVAGEETPFGARILALADAFDAMTSDRPYRPAMPLAAAIKEIKRCSGTQFDPVVVQAFLNIKAPALTRARSL